MKYTQHALSAAFPAMSKEDFQSLKDSIENNGVLNPITLFEGQVIDGWHRYRAATELAMDCQTQDMDPALDPKDYVLAQNKNRRHITVAQLAAATTAVYGWRSVGQPQKYSALSTELKTSKEIAAIAGVSEKSIVQAKAIQAKASPAVQQAVKDGKIGLPKAVAISKLPKKDQAAAIDKPLPKKQKPEAAQPEPEHFGPDEAELKAQAQAERDDMAALQKLIDSDDALKAATDEIKRLNALVRVLESRIGGLMNSNNENIRAAKSWKRKYEKASREIAA